MEKRYTREGFTVVWEPEKCAHSETCWRNLPTVFQPTARPWVKLENATEAEIKATVEKCPSGALTFEKETP